MAEKRKPDKFLKRNRRDEWRCKFEKKPVKQEWSSVNKERYLSK